MHTGSLYNHTRDPEGLLSTLPAIATTLIGCVTSCWLCRVVVRPSSIKSPSEFAQRGFHFAQREEDCHSDPERSGGEESPYFAHAAPETSPTSRLAVLILSGLLSLTLGLLWSLWFPINKNLWTSSYVLFAAGLSLLLLALCYWLIDIRRLNDQPAGRWLLRPWLIFGSNAITAFVVSNFLVELMLWIKVPAGGLVNLTDPTQRISAWLWTYRHIFARHNSTEITSLAFAVAFTALCFIPNWLLWRRKIFLKI